jgi:hypothetical protein
MDTYEFLLTATLPVAASQLIESPDYLEISLPCISCQRSHRTIIFDGLNVNGICTPKDLCNGFAGQLKNKTISAKGNAVELQFRIEMRYEVFVDKKYDKEAVLSEHHWARIRFTLKCLKCGKIHTITSQENSGRPWREQCDCGSLLYEEIKTPFSYDFKKKSLQQD